MSRVTPSASAGNASLVKRIVSAAVLAPLVLGIVYVGEWPYVALLFAVAMVLSAEWTKLCRGAGFDRVFVVLAAASGAAAILSALGWMAAAWGAILAGGLLVCLAQWVRREGAAWPLLGVFYICIPVLSLVWLRFEPFFGLELILWLLAIIWATDTAAYLVGSRVGGPKLAPRISPNKTISGSLGGLAAAAAIGGALAHLYDLELVEMILGSVAFSVVAQIGDLFESAIKRHFKVKDSGDLIPGHGGLFDRIDSLLFGATVMAAAAAAPALTRWIG